MCMKQKTPEYHTRQEKLENLVVWNIFFYFFFIFPYITRWGPHGIAKLVQISAISLLFMVVITMFRWDYKPTDITRGPHIVGIIIPTDKIIYSSEGRKTTSPTKLRQGWSFCWLLEWWLQQPRFFLRKTQNSAGQPPCFRQTRTIFLVLWTIFVGSTLHFSWSTALLKYGTLILVPSRYKLL